MAYLDASFGARASLHRLRRARLRCCHADAPAERISGQSVRPSPFRRRPSLSAADDRGRRVARPRPGCGRESRRSRRSPSLAPCAPWSSRTRSSAIAQTGCGSGIPSSRSEHSTANGRRQVTSRQGAVAQVNHAVAEAAFVQQIELQADIIGEGLFAASHHHGREEQVALVD
jgi:hypothetical protein